MAFVQSHHMSTKLPSCTLFCRSERGIHSKKCEREQAKKPPLALSAGVTFTFTTSASVPIVFNGPDSLKHGVDATILSKLKTCEPYKVQAPIAPSPDYTEVITAWRGWRVYGNRLRAIGGNTIWEPNAHIQAQCNNHGTLPDPFPLGIHEAPQLDCTCGIWAFKSLDGLVEALKSYPAAAVIGKVALWGRVVETENGFRAEKAYPVELWLTDDKYEHLGYRYNVPVRSLKKET